MGRTLIRRWHVAGGAFGIVASLLLVATGTLAAPQAAGLPQSLGLSIADCTPAALGASAAAEALATELQSDGVSQVALSPQSAAEAELRITMLCGPTIETQVTLARPSTGKVATATLSLSDVSLEQRPRALALAASELVRGYWSVLAERDATVDLSSQPPLTAMRPVATGGDASHVMLPDDTGESSPPPSSLPKTSPTLPVSPRVRQPLQPRGALRDITAPRAHEDRLARGVGAAFSSRWFVQQPTLFVGAALELRSAAFRAGAEALIANSEDPLGQVSSGLGNVRVSALLEVWSSNAWSWGLGPRAALGLTWASARASSTAGSASDAIGLYADAAAETELSWWVSERTQTAFALEAGGARGIAARAGARTVAASGGWFIGSRLGLRYALP